MTDRWHRATLHYAIGRLVRPADPELATLLEGIVDHVGEEAGGTAIVVSSTTLDRDLGFLSRPLHEAAQEAMSRGCELVPSDAWRRIVGAVDPEIDPRAHGDVVAGVEDLDAMLGHQASLLTQASDALGISGGNLVEAAQETMRRLGEKIQTIDGLVSDLASLTAERDAARREAEDLRAGGTTAVDALRRVRETLGMRADDGTPLPEAVAGVAARASASAMTIGDLRSLLGLGPENSVVVAVEALKAERDDVETRRREAREDLAAKTALLGEVRTVLLDADAVGPIDAPLTTPEAVRALIEDRDAWRRRWCETHGVEPLQTSAAEGAPVVLDKEPLEDEPFSPKAPSLPYRDLPVVMVDRAPVPDDWPGRDRTPPFVSAAELLKGCRVGALSPSEARLAEAADRAEAAAIAREAEPAEPAPPAVYRWAAAYTPEQAADAIGRLAAGARRAAVASAVDVKLATADAIAKRYADEIERVRATDPEERPAVLAEILAGFKVREAVGEAA